ncbi:MAG: ATP-binding protein [Actinomycetota bacterium]
MSAKTETGGSIEEIVQHLPRWGTVRLRMTLWRVDEARSAGTGGAGLGLAICRSIIEAHGGRMTIESQLGAGTAVSIRLLLCPRT